MHCIKAFNTVKHARNQKHQKRQEYRFARSKRYPATGILRPYSNRINTEALYSWDF